MNYKTFFRLYLLDITVTVLSALSLSIINGIIRTFPNAVQFYGAIPVATTFMIISGFTAIIATFVVATRFREVLSSLRIDS